MGARILALTALAMVAFAANSVIGRLGLIEGGIGAGSFAAIRLVSGGIVLALLAGPANTVRAGSWTGGIALLSYAAFFSYAYLSLPAGTGALLLFAVVQVTMVGAGILSGERLSAVQWTGLIAAFAGLVWLVSPGLQAPPLLGALAMGVAGIGWGVYSLLGRSGGDPTANTAGNFVRASLLALVLLPPALLLAPEPAPHLTGIALAVLSGAVTSGLGYAVWYTALKGLSATQAG
ncbi:MAG: DMT family transporter, partial [Pseudomonadota bacterium]